MKGKGASACMQDVFFQTEYGKLYESIDGGVCETFDFSCAYGSVRHMFIKRPVPWLVDGRQYYDIRTPYGYGGPVASDVTDIDALAEAYNAAFAEYAADSGIVSAFIRFHLYDNVDLRVRYGPETVYMQDNIVCDLTPPLPEQWMRFDHKVRKNVNRAVRAGLSVLVDAAGERLDDFLRVYYDTMERNHAGTYYYFDRTYFTAIRDTLPGRYCYFHVLEDDAIVATELCLCSDKYVYSFLGGTLAEHYANRPNDLLKHEIIRWGKETGREKFILGGGYHKGDGIYSYKKAFAPYPEGEVPFYAGKTVYNPEVYGKLAARAAEGKSLDEGYFPLYRG